jgi:hypothetical protein
MRLRLHLAAPGCPCPEESAENPFAPKVLPMSPAGITVTMSSE